MRVAVLLCGQARYFREGYESIRTHILNVYHPDVYIHTWSSTKPFEAAPWNKLGPLTISDADIQEYIALYAPIRWKVDPALQPLDPADPARTSAPQTRTNFTSYATSLKRCHALVESSYDAFIILRCDAILFRMPHPSTTRILVWDRLGYRGNVLDTHVCSVPSDSIRDVVSLVDNLEAYYDAGYVFNYEELFHAHFTEQDLYSVTDRLSRDKLEWGYWRGSRVERM
jgi:hypothetical protein